jgi:uncharacterized phage-associated protein
VPVKNANDIATWFVRYSADGLGTPVDPMSLEKWLYYAQAFYLVLKDEPLFQDEIQAWKWGPVIPAVYKKYQTFGAGPIVFPADGGAPKLDDDCETFLIEVVDFLSRHTSMNLSRATHLETPWIDASQLDDNEIPQSSMKGFYHSLTEEGEAALSKHELLDSVPEPRWSSYYVAGICLRKMSAHPFYDGALAKTLATPMAAERRYLPDEFFAPVKGRDFIEFGPDDNIDEKIRRVVS